MLDYFLDAIPRKKKQKRKTPAEGIGFIAEKMARLSGKRGIAK